MITDQNYKHRATDRVHKQGWILKLQQAKNNSNFRLHNFMNLLMIFQ